jgi:hypothetical protein
MAELGHLPRVATPVSANGVATAAIPLRPADAKVADLVASFPGIRRLRDELDLVHDRVLMNHVEERGASEAGTPHWGRDRPTTRAPKYSIRLPSRVAGCLLD